MIKTFVQKISPLIFNSTLFIFLFLSIQNSNNEQRVFFLNYKSVEIPVSFIVGSSFICGSLYSTLLISLISKKDE